MTVSELKTNNPWRVVADKYDSGKSNCLFLEDGNTDYVHPEDLDRIIKFNSRNPDKEYCIVTNTPPEPWRGNPLTARLIILSLNPGYIPEINMTLATSRGSKKRGRSPSHPRQRTWTSLPRGLRQTPGFV